LENTEIERKFLIDKDTFEKELTSLNFEKIQIKQGYMFDTNKGVVRIRQAGTKHFLTIKSPVKGITRREVEMEVSKEQGEILLNEFCDAFIEKERYVFSYVDGEIWEVDVFKGKLSGLIIAEIELDSEEREFYKPEWLDKEVSSDKKYFNNNLLKRIIEEL